MREVAQDVEGQARDARRQARALLVLWSRGREGGSVRERSVRRKERRAGARAPCVHVTEISEAT